jgi:hypothetical protein
VAVLLSKPKKGKPPAQTRLCVHCGQTKPLSSYYSNKDWIDNDKKDCWCKQCLAKIRTKDELRRYFWENNRMWKENVWENACKQGELQAAKSTAYQKSNDERRQILLESIACPLVFKLMQQTQNYKYEEHKKDVNVNDYDEAKETGKIVDISTTKPKDKNIKVYNEFFNGEFKPAEIEYLEEYYKGLEQNFNLSDTSLRDNAKKLAKASLLVDKIQNDYMAGRCSSQDVKDAIAQYDLLMKTGNFAACKRKPGDKEGMSSWSELTLHLETHGFLADKLVYWDKDDVDRTIEEFRYITEAIGLDTL